MNDLSRYEEYKSKDIPELKLFYQRLPGEVDICDATIHGEEICDALFDIVVDARRAYWESKIEAHLKKVAEDQAMDQSAEDWENYRFMGRGAA